MERTTYELGAMSELQQHKQQNTTTSSEAAFEACDIMTFCELLFSHSVSPNNSY